jgi:hypothetical protein
MSYQPTQAELRSVAEAHADALEGATFRARRALRRPLWERLDLWRRLRLVVQLLRLEVLRARLRVRRWRS